MEANGLNRFGRPKLNEIYRNAPCLSSLGAKKKNDHKRATNISIDKVAEIGGLVAEENSDSG